MADGPLRQIAAVFGIEWDKEGKLSKGNGQIEATISRVNTLAGALAGSALVLGVKSAIGGVLDFANAYEEAAGLVEDSANRLGVTTDELQSLQFAGQAAGVGADMVNAAISKLSLQLGQTKAGPAAEALRKLGVAAKDSSGEVRPVQDVMEDVAEAMDSIENPAQRIALATQLFGEAGARLAPILRSGEGGLAALREEFTSLGGAMSGEAIEAAGAYGDAMDRFGVVAASAKAVLATALLPALTVLVKRLAAGISWLIKAPKALRSFIVSSVVLQKALIALAIVMTARLIPSLLRAIVSTALYDKVINLTSKDVEKMAIRMLTWARTNGVAALSTMGWVAAIALIVLALDDFIGMMNGADSVLGRWLDKTFGAGTQEHVVFQLGEAWKGVKLALSDAEAALGRWWNSAKASVAGVFASITELAAGIVEPFTKAWNAIDEALGGALGKMWDKVRAFVAPVVDVFQKIGSAIAAGVSGAASFVSEIPASIAKDWRELILNQPTGPARPRPAGTAPATQTATRPATQTATARSAAQARTVTSNRTVNVGTIRVDGTNNPEAVARAVREEIDRRAAVDNDADHPQGNAG